MTDHVRAGLRHGGYGPPQSMQEAQQALRREITTWIRWYNTERPHQALGYRSPTEWRAQQLTQVA